LLILKKSFENEIKQIVNDFGGIKELPFIGEENLSELIKNSIIAVESENSLWVAEKMSDYNKKLKPMKRFGGKLGLLC